MSGWDAFILGFVQGITEFLPVSSSAHLVFFRSLLDTLPEIALTFDAIVHLATGLAVLVYFRKDLLHLFHVTLRLLSREVVNKTDQVLLFGLILATIPAVLVGVFFESIIEKIFTAPAYTAGFLLVSALIFMISEYCAAFRKREKQLTRYHALGIGLAQALALFPGVSRSGITIATGMILGLSRVAATRFSFLLAVPIVLGAGAKKLLTIETTLFVVDWWVLLIAFAVAFLSAILAIHWFLKFVQKYTLWPFVWYILVLAGVILYIEYGGY